MRRSTVTREEARAARRERSLREGRETKRMVESRKVIWREQLRAGLILGLDVGEAARRLGIPETTARRMAGEPEMVERVRAGVEKVLAPALRKIATVQERLAAEEMRNVETLVALRDDPKVNPAVRVQCATQMLDRGSSAIRGERRETVHRLDEGTVQRIAEAGREMDAKVVGRKVQTVTLDVEAEAAP